MVPGLLPINPLGRGWMISLKQYLDRTSEERAARGIDETPCAAIVEVYVSSLRHMGESGGHVCPAREQDLKRGMMHIVEMLRSTRTLDSVVASEIAVRELLQGWGKDVAAHYDQKAADVRDLLLVISRTADSLCHKDDRVARSIDSVTRQLASITTLNDVSRIRASIEASARDLKQQVEK